mmetsp:Transcript_26522/g.67945  ORF Transcript_26522/g.67945 Transcript_26522/m.67945 type:complete len:110 (-) Transcript_26522:3441-3770(-)
MMEPLPITLTTKEVNGRWKHLKDGAMFERVGGDKDAIKEGGANRNADDRESENELVVCLSGRECKEVDDEWTPVDTDEEAVRPEQSVHKDGCVRPSRVQVVIGILRTPY